MFSPCSHDIVRAEGALLTRASKQELARLIPDDCVHASAVTFERWKLLLHPFDKAFDIQELVTYLWLPHGSGRLHMTERTDDTVPSEALMRVMFAHGGSRCSGLISCAVLCCGGRLSLAG